MAKSSLAVLGYGVSFQLECVAQELGFEGADMLTSLLPARLRRRTSIATKMAFSAAERACRDAEIQPSELAVIFTSSLGESAVTDQLCRDIARQNFPLSPTKFHNSVHNTASGYWSIAVGNTHPAMAMGAYQDSFALGLLEAWSQLHSIEKRVLLICYEETPSDLLLPDNQWVACATAFVLGREKAQESGILRITMPSAIDKNTVGKLWDASLDSPAVAALPLIEMLKHKLTGKVLVSATAQQNWYVNVLQDEA